jgi:hypothetical protein
VLHGPNGTEQRNEPCATLAKEPRRDNNTICYMEPMVQNRKEPSRRYRTQCATWNQGYRMGTSHVRPWLKNHVLPWLKSPEDIEHNVLHGTKGIERERTMCCLLLRKNPEVFRTVGADGPQCRRCQALCYWGSGGGLEWVG